MIKQPLLPLKWYNELEEQQFRNLMDATGGEGWVKLRSDVILPIPFQIKRDNRANVISQFDLVNYDTGAVVNISTVHLDIKTATIDETNYDWIVYDGRPWNVDVEEGFYYFIVSDDIETWYSEVFELCDLLTNLVNDGINDSFDSFSDTTSSDIKREQWNICKSTTGAGEATAHSNTFDVIYNEPLDLFLYTNDASIGCGYASYGDSVNYELRDASGNVVSNTVTARNEVYTWNCFTLTPTYTGTVRLYVWLADADQAEQTNLIYLWPKKITDHTVVEWYDDINFCDIIYSDSYDNNNCDYKNRLYLHKSHVVRPNYTIDEDAVESDEKETHPLIQSAKKYYTLEFAGGHHLSDAMSIVRLHDDINFYLETGEIINVCDFSMNSGAIASNDYCEQIELTFREAACAKSACDEYDLDCCCPNLENALDYIAGGVPGMPGQPCCDGDRYLGLTGGKIYVYESDGAAWNRMTDEEVKNNCIYDEDANASSTYNDYFAYDEGQSAFRALCQLTGVVDAGGGNAGLSGTGFTSSEFNCPVYVQAQVDLGTGFNDLGDPVTLDDFVNNGITAYTGTVNNVDFRIKYYTHNCDLSYDGDITQSIA